MRRPTAWRATACGAVLLLLAMLAGWFAPPAFFAAWLAAWWCCVGIVMGACINLWMHRLTGGRWGEVLRPAAAAVVARRIWLGPLFVPVLLGLSVLYPWARAGADPFASLDQPGFLRAWFTLPAFGLRCAVYGVVWYLLSGSALRPAVSRHRVAASLVVYTLLGSLASADFLMALTPGWRSTGFGLRVLASQALGGAALLVLALAWTAPQRLREPATRGGGVPVGRDLGNLLMMYVLLWAYLAFMQFLIIWAENLPNEISWFVPRLQTGWFGIGVALVVLHLALPLLLLVMRAVKDRPARLGAVAVLLLLAHAVDSVWLVAPSVAPHALAHWWLAPLCLLGMGLLLFAPIGAAPAHAPPAADASPEVAHASA